MTKRIVYFLLILVLGFLIQSAAMQVFGDQAFLIPQFFLLLVVICAVDQGYIQTLWLSFAAGFLGEFFGVFYFGAQIVSAVAIASIAYALTRKITLREVTLPMAMFLVGLLTTLGRLLPYLYQLLADWLNLAESLEFSRLFSWQLVWLYGINLVSFFAFNLLIRKLPNEKSF